MKKRVFGRQFKRDANERKALFKNLLTSLVLEERIRTTEAKAKAIKGDADRLITYAKKGGDSAIRSLHSRINQDAVTKLIQLLAPRFVKRQGGYTRIIRDGRRVADNAQMVYLEWTERIEKGKSKGEKEEKKQESGSKSQGIKDDTKKQSQKSLLTQKAVKTAKEPVQKQIKMKRGDK